MWNVNDAIYGVVSEYWVVGFKDMVSWQVRQEFKMWTRIALYISMDKWIHHTFRRVFVYKKAVRPTWGLGILVQKNFGVTGSEKSFFAPTMSPFSPLILQLYFLHWFFWRTAGNCRWRLICPGTTSDLVWPTMSSWGWWYMWQVDSGTSKFCGLNACSTTSRV